MTEYALIDPDGEVNRTATNVDPTVQTRAGWEWLPVEVTNPSYDPTTQVKEGPTVTVLADKVTRVWTVRDKTADELDADKDAVISAFDMLAFKVLFNHENRIRALEGKGTVTAAQFRTAMKALL
jgi:hypothetical protein